MTRDMEVLWDIIDEMGAPDSTAPSSRAMSTWLSTTRRMLAPVALYLPTACGDGMLLFLKAPIAGGEPAHGWTHRTQGIQWYLLLPDSAACRLQPRRAENAAPQALTQGRGAPTNTFAKRFLESRGSALAGAST